ncbi:hypothetical protein LCE26_23835 (plasmid) [Escherichia coli]|nr:hypothetical protein LCE26_23835 [Escherichia coli]
MKTFNKSQSVFIFAVMLVAAWFAGSFIFFCALLQPDKESETIEGCVQIH